MLVLLLKLVVFASASWTAHTTELNRRSYARSYHHVRVDPRFAGTGSDSLWEMLSAADAQWYASIAQSGYPSRDEFTVEGCGDEVRLTTTCENFMAWAFFPAWPALVRVLSPLAADPLAVGFVASNILSLAAAIVLFLYVRTRSDDARALITVLLFCASPFAVFLDAPFTESLFLLLVAGIFLAAQRGAWPVVGVLFALLSVTRPNGIFLAVVPLTFLIREMAARRRFSWRRASQALWLGLALVPFAAWLIFNHAKTGDATFFFTVQRRWFSGQPGLDNLIGNLAAVFRLPDLQWHNFHSSRVDALVMAASLLILALGMRRLQSHETVYTAAIMIVPLIAKDLLSYSRYVMPAWPLFFILAAVFRRRAWLFGLLLLVSLLGQVVLTMRLVNWEWVG